MWFRWLEQTEADVPAGDDWLSREEARRLADMRFPKRRADWRLGRWTAKQAVAACLDEPHDLPAIEIRAHPCGAPEVFLAGSPAPVAISISHRGGVACSAVAEAGVAIGCDLELAEERSSAFVTDYFTSEEQTLIADTPKPDLPMILALIWSAKESALKALRVGLRADTRSVCVSHLRIWRSEAWQPLVVRHGTGAFQGMWQIKGAMVRTLLWSGPNGTPAPAFPAPHRDTRSS